MLLTKSFYKYLLCVLFISASLQGHEILERKAKMPYLHAIIVADTLDGIIGDHVKVDLNNMIKEVGKIARYTNMNLNLITIKNSDVNHKKIFSTIKKIKVDCDDTVLFYFSGHGYRTNTKRNNPWPDLSMLGGKTGIDFSLIVEKILKKSPRLILAVADSCNKRKNGVTTFRELTRSKSDKCVKDNYRRLFLRGRGLVMAAGAVPHELSYCYCDGSVYTLALLKIIDEETRNRNPGMVDWYTVMVGAQNKANRWKNQHPYWIYLEDIKDQRAVLNKIGR